MKQDHRMTVSLSHYGNRLKVSGNNEVELKGGMYTFMSLKLHTLDLDVIDARIADKVQQAPGFFKDSPVVVDVSEVEEQVANGDFDAAALFERVFDCVKSHKLVPIVVGVSDKSSPIAASIALPLMESGIKRQNANTNKKSSGSSEDSDGAASGESSNAGSNSGGSAGGSAGVSLHMGSAGAGDATQSEKDQLPSADDTGLDLATAKQVEVVVKTPMLITRPVRSGQQVFARDTDLIVMGPVGAGAEVLADQNIHVYGPLRGRALCGVSGNSSTRIFCQSLEAELVSVDGNFRLLEEIPADLRGKPAQIWLDKGRLNIEPLVDSNLSGVIA